MTDTQILVGDLIVPVVSTTILIAVALGVSAWSFRRQEL